MKENKFILQSSCIPVQGKNRSVICDLQTDNYYFIPNSLYEILLFENGKTLKAIKKKFNNNFDEIIDEYFNFLTKNNLILFVNNKKGFTKLDLSWNNNYKINNSIIDICKDDHDIKGILVQLENLKCSNLQFRFFDSGKSVFFKEILDFINIQKLRFTHIDFILPFDNEYLEISKKYNDEPRIHSIIFYNSGLSKFNSPNFKNMGHVIFTENKIINEISCGIIDFKYFHSNIKLFTESQHHNTCLNSKISIDKDGYIRNCPSMPEHFGNIKDTSLEEALNHPDFKKYWNVTKDMIEVCKDCEFRHICTDCRAYTERTHFEGDIDLSKPLKCGYNPYTNEWAEWSTNPLKQKAIEYYGMQELIKKEA